VGQFNKSVQGSVPIAQGVTSKMWGGALDSMIVSLPIAKHWFVQTVLLLELEEVKRQIQELLD
jgi:hypothetical protein